MSESRKAGDSMYSYSSDMSLSDFQDNFMNDNQYRDFCKRIYEKLGNKAYKQENDVQKNTMCFVLALFFNGISQDLRGNNPSGKCGYQFAHEVAGFSSFSSWTRQAGGFYRIGKNGELDIQKEDSKKMKELYTETTLQDALKWFFEDSGIEIYKDKEKLKKSANSMMRILTMESQFEGIRYAQNFDVVSLLKKNKQLILNGAPGTGKTFSAKHEIVDGLLGYESDAVLKEAEKKDELDKKQKDLDIRMGMVQFHPSYDYTDFIEGIRPNLDGSNISYTLKNGSFKEFCCIAGVPERMKAAKVTYSEENLKKYLHLKEDDSKNKYFCFWKKYFENDHGETSELPPFLFIIDEINRAEISKVLGEIMYCLDPDYRGVKGKIKTQYANSATEDSFYIDKEDDGFFIPSNVYIVGTMNDIDRSVEMFDFALRRRFAWHEVKAQDVMDEVLKSMKVDVALGAVNYHDYLGRIERVNKDIEDLLGLSRHYHLGPSYFAKIVSYYDDNYKEALESVWNNHIAQILTEYVKGKRQEERIPDMMEDFLLFEAIENPQEDSMNTETLDDTEEV